jgi:hypothetical protein
MNKTLIAIATAAVLASSRAWAAWEYHGEFARVR